MILIYALLPVNNDQDALNLQLSELKGISGENLYIVSVNEIGAVASDVKAIEAISDRSCVLEYAEVIERLARQFTLLPVRFGSAMKSTDAIVQLLIRNRDEITDNIGKVSGKIEFGLKVFCDADKLSEELKEQSGRDSNVPAISGGENHRSVYREYITRKLQVHRQEELLVTYVDSVIDKIKVSLSVFDASCKFKKMTTASNIINTAILVKKEEKDELVIKIENLQTICPGLSFVLTGPWPPYSFVDFTVKHDTI
jgi:hypothetical protein